MTWNDDLMKYDDLDVDDWSMQTMMNHTEWSEIIKWLGAAGSLGLNLTP